MSLSRWYLANPDRSLVKVYVRMYCIGKEISLKWAGLQGFWTVSFQWKSYTSCDVDFFAGIYSCCFALAYFIMRWSFYYHFYEYTIVLRYMKSHRQRRPRSYEYKRTSSIHGVLINIKVKTLLHDTVCYCETTLIIPIASSLQCESTLSSCFNLYFKYCSA